MSAVLRAVLLAVLLCSPVYAETVAVAAAANFRDSLDALVRDFGQATGHEAIVSAGSSGQLFAQIAHGAPYDVFLSADEARPSKAVEAGLAVAGTQRTYAKGRLIVLFGDPDAEAAKRRPPDLAQFRSLSIANPATAPYGAAAMQVLQSMGVAGALAGRIAQAQNVSGVIAAVESGAAEAGFAALGSVAQPGGPEPQGWLVPTDLHDPILQDAVLLVRGRENVAALAFLEYLASDRAKTLIRDHGYQVE